MDDFAIPGGDAGRRELQEFLSRYDVPAYVRRARRVEETLEDVLRLCRARREEWLVMPRLLVGRLRGLAGEWSVLRPWLADDAQLEVLERLHATLAPRPRVRVAPTGSARALRPALHAAVASAERFNARWLEHVRGVDLASANAARDGYNRYYLLEKECAVRSPRLARQGFRPLPPLTPDDVLALLPPLPVPRLAGAGG